jgi:hypothetical protein
MGDRANIVVKQGKDLPPVILYTHWEGYELPETLRFALAKRWRWNDHAYLTRIIFDVMTAGSQGEETGFGISTGLPDNEHPLLIVDPTDQTVAVGGPTASVAIDVEVATHPDWAKPIATYTFEEYVALDKATWEALGG